MYNRRSCMKVFFRENLQKVLLKIIVRNLFFRIYVPLCLLESLWIQLKIKIQGRLVNERQQPNKIYDGCSSLFFFIVNLFDVFEFLVEI